MIRVCTPCAPRVYTVCAEGAFSGEDGDLTVLDPGFLSKFVKNCPKGVPFFDPVHTFILPDLSIKYTKNTGVHTLCTPGLQKVSSHYVTLCVSAGNSILHRGIENF